MELDHMVENCPTCGGTDTVPEDEAGDDWLSCIEFTGRGSKDPVGANMPTGWLITDLIKTVKVFRDRKVVEIPPAEYVKGKDKVIKAIMDEDLIGELYDGDDRAITLNSPDGRLPEGHTDGWTRLEWYQRFGRDGLRTLATSRIKLGLQQPKPIGMVGP